MADFADLARQVGFVLLILAPSALLGVFPFWLALRRGRPAAGVAALTSCVAVAFVGINVFGSLTYDPFGPIVFGGAVALVAAVAWSFLLWRWTS